MLYCLRAAILALLVSIPVVAQTKVTVCWIEPALSVKDSPFSHEQIKLQGRVDLIQRDKLDWTRIVIPPELRARPIENAKPLNLLVPLSSESRHCQIADRLPNGSLQLH